MSRTALKKELKILGEEQVKDMILDLYSSCREAREYLDFFIDPDVQVLYDRYRKELSKEVWRGKYNNSTARISRIRAIIKKFESFNTGPEWTLDFMHDALLEMLDVEYRRYVSAPFIKGICRLATDILRYGEEQFMFDKALGRLDDTLARYPMSSGMRDMLRHWIQDFTELAKPLHK